MAPVEQPWPSISVVICCHNSGSRLPETLRHLAEQCTPAGLRWETLVIDNASTDNTASVVDQLAAQYPSLPLRLVGEPKLGTAYARQRGIAEALYEIVLFVDDDNWLAPNYLALVTETFREHPEIDGLGGMSTACCEGPEPSWLQRFERWYAVTGPARGKSMLSEDSFLWTAGTAFRRRTLDRIRDLGAPLLVSGRRGQSLDAGEDHELCYLIRLSGGKLYRHSGLHFRHYLPASRLTWDYLKRLHHGGGLVSVKLDAYRLSSTNSIWPQWILQCWSAHLVNVCLQILVRRIALWCSPAVEGDPRVLNLEVYRGRLEALWTHRHRYRQMIARAAAAANS